MIVIPEQSRELSCGEDCYDECEALPEDRLLYIVHALHYSSKECHLITVGIHLRRISRPCEFDIKLEVVAGSKNFSGQFNPD